MNVKPLMTMTLAAGFVAIGIAVTMVTGLWQTESNKTPRTLKLEETAITNTQTDEVHYDPADIRGSYTFGEISDLYQIPLADLASAFGLSEGEAVTFQTKSLESLFPDAQVEMGTTSVRLFTAYYLGLPYEPSEETYLPAIAAIVLTRSGNMTIAQAEYVSSHILP